MTKTLSMINYKFGSVVLVGFPFTNLQTTKKRPAVIINHINYQKQRPDIILMAITSRIRQPLTIGEALIQDWQIAGLAKPSLFKPLIATIARERVIKIMGQLTKEDQQTLQAIILEIIGPQNH